MLLTSCPVRSLLPAKAFFGGIGWGLASQHVQVNDHDETKEGNVP